VGGDHQRHRLGSRLSLGLCVSLGAAPLFWAAAAAGAQSSQQDRSLPIEITADRLDVVQPSRVATFTGHVDAVQGDMVLSADQLRVYYNGQGPGAGPTSATSAPGGGSIRRIEAEGNVFLSSPTQTAQGKTGVYDVASDRLTLEGAVVLTQGNDVIRGDRLEVDLASGRSHVFAAVPSSAGGEPQQRVRALFVPQPATPAPAAGPAKTKAAPPTGAPSTKVQATE
jgi:lipopolysaccharide export system protein LptA